MSASRMMAAANLERLATVWRRRADSAHGGDDSTARAASQKPILGEKGEEDTPELAVDVDLSGEEQNSVAARGRRRRLRYRAGERKGEGGCGTFLQGSPWFFEIYG